jgi:hypothetical protein
MSFARFIRATSMLPLGVKRVVIASTAVVAAAGVNKPSFDSFKQHIADKHVDHDHRALVKPGLNIVSWFGWVRYRDQGCLRPFVTTTASGATRWLPWVCLGIGST